jgi:hypothetical protein
MEEVVGSIPTRSTILLSPTNQSLRAGHYLTINVTGILTGGTLELELVAVTVIVKVPAGVPGDGGVGVGGCAEPPRGGAEPPPPQLMQSSTANAPVAKTQRGVCLLALSR